MEDDWEADDWDDDAVEAKLLAQEKEKDKARKRAEGLDDESEDDNVEPLPKVATDPSPFTKSTPKGAAATKSKTKANQNSKEKTNVAEPMPLDPKAERLRRQQLEEAANDAIAADVFAGFERKNNGEEEGKKKEKEAAKVEARRAAAKPKIVEVDEFDSVELKIQTDVEKIAEACVDKISRAKGRAEGAGVRFFLDVLKQTEAKMTVVELADLEKTISEIVKDKKAVKAVVNTKANKAATKLNKTTKFNADEEWAEMYGGAGQDDEWTQEEWEEWENSQRNWK